MDTHILAILGLGTGGIYALSALGVLLVYRCSGVVNFAHPAIGLLGVITFVETRPTIGAEAALVIGVLVSAAVGALVYLVIMMPLRDATTLMKLIATIAVALTVSAAASFFLSADPSPVKGFLPSWQASLIGVSVPSDRIVILGIAVVLTAVLWAAYRYTPFGLRSSAVAESATTSAAYGISTVRVCAQNWALAGGLSAFAAILIVPITGLTPTTFSSSFIVVLAAALLGAFRSFPGTLLGGLIIGSSQAAAGPLFPNVNGIATAVPFLLIVAVLLLRGSRLSFKASSEQRLPSVGSGHINVPALLIGATVTLLVIWNLEDFRWIDAAILSVCAALVLLSLVVITGYAGQITLMQYTLAGLGAWIAARLVADLGLPFGVALVGAMIIALPIGALVGLPALRIRGVHLAIATFGFAAMIDAMVFNNDDLNGGFGGYAIGSATIFGIDISPILYPQRYFTVALVFFVLIALALASMRRGTAGRRLLAVRTNERAAASIGVNVTMAKLYAFVIGSAIAASGGVLLAFRNPTLLFNGHYPPESSSAALAESVVGGVGWLAGPLLGVHMRQGSVGAVAIDNIGGDSGNWLNLIAGILLLAIIYLHRDGLASVNAHAYRAIRDRLRRTPRRVDLDKITRPVHLERPPASLHVADLSVRFGGVHALTSASLTVEPGQVVGLIGPNGSGKSTTVEAITGFVRPASGTIELGGMDLRAKSTHQRSRAGLARSFQSLELFEDMTVLDNLRAASDTHHWTSYLTDLVVPQRHSLSAAARAAIEEFGLADDLLITADQLPFGKRRLVAIARAVAPDPVVLLLDEPAAGLSGAERQELGRLLRRLVKGGRMGILLVEHDVDLVMEVCDRIVALEAGSVIADGTPDEVRSNPEVIRAYLGTEEEETTPPASAHATPARH